MKHTISSRIKMKPNNKAGQRTRVIETPEIFRVYIQNKAKHYNYNHYKPVMGEKGLLHFVKNLVDDSPNDMIVSAYMHEEFDMVAHKKFRPLAKCYPRYEKHQKKFMAQFLVQLCMSPEMKVLNLTNEELIIYTNIVYQNSTSLLMYGKSQLDYVFGQEKDGKVYKGGLPICAPVFSKNLHSLIEKGLVDVVYNKGEIGENRWRGRPHYFAKIPLALLDAYWEQYIEAPSKYLHAYNRYLVTSLFMNYAQTSVSSSSRLRVLYHLFFKSFLMCQGKIEFTYESLAKEVGSSKKLIFAALNDLKDSGLIDLHKGKAGSCTTVEFNTSFFNQFTEHTSDKMGQFINYLNKFKTLSDLIDHVDDHREDTKDLLKKRIFDFANSGLIDSSDIKESLVVGGTSKQFHDTSISFSSLSTHPYLQSDWGRSLVTDISIVIPRSLTENIIPVNALQKALALKIKGSIMETQVKSCAVASLSLLSSPIVPLAQCIGDRLVGSANPHADNRISELIGSLFQNIQLDQLLMDSSDQVRVVSSAFTNVLVEKTNGMDLRQTHELIHVFDKNSSFDSIETFVTHWSSILAFIFDGPLASLLSDLMSYYIVKDLCDVQGICFFNELTTFDEIRNLLFYNEFPVKQLAELPDCMADFKSSITNKIELAMSMIGLIYRISMGVYKGDVPDYLNNISNVFPDKFRKGRNISIETNIDKTLRNSPITRHGGKYLTESELRANLYFIRSLNAYFKANPDMKPLHASIFGNKFKFYNGINVVNYIKEIRISIAKQFTDLSQHMKVNREEFDYVKVLNLDYKKQFGDVCLEQLYSVILADELSSIDNRLNALDRYAENLDVLKLRTASQRTHTGHDVPSNTASRLLKSARYTNLEGNVAYNKVDESLVETLVYQHGNQLRVLGDKVNAYINNSLQGEFSCNMENGFVIKSKNVDYIYEEPVFLNTILKGM